MTQEIDIAALRKAAQECTVCWLSDDTLLALLDRLEQAEKDAARANQFVRQAIQGLESVSQHCASHPMLPLPGSVFMEIYYVMRNLKEYRDGLGAAMQGDGT